MTESFLPAINGVTNSVLQVLAHLRRRGHEAVVVAPGAGPEEVDGVSVVRLPALDLAVVDSLPVGVPTPALRATLEEFRPDVVHLASPFVVGARALTVARRLGVPTVAVYQTDVAGFAASYGVGLTARAAWRWTRRLHARADRTLAPSRWAVEALAEHGVPRVHRWGRGVDTARFRPGAPGAAALRAELAPRGELLVGYVGRLAAEKQVRRLAELDGIPGIRLVVVGDGPERAWLEKRLPDAVFTGQLLGDELAAAFASLDVFVHTGEAETFCQTVQEAQASGVPVVAPAVGGPVDLVDHRRTGLLHEPGDPPSLRRSVSRLVWDASLRRSLGRNARAEVEGRSWSAMVQELVDVHYASVLAPRAQRPAA